LIAVRIPPRTRRVFRLIAQLPERAAKMRAAFTFFVADRVSKLLQEKIPTAGEWRAYRSSLRVAKVSGLSSKESAFALSADQTARRVRQVDVPQTLLYIRSRRRLRRPDPKIVVLEKYGPWTMDILPFMPKSTEAHIVARRVTEREAEKVRKFRQADRVKWRRALAEVGVRPSEHAQPKVAPDAKAVPDLALSALRLEFGLGGTKAQAHWRPAIRDLRSKAGLRALIQDQKGLLWSLTKPEFRKWRRWPPRTSRRIKSSEASTFLAFQSKLGA